MGNPADTTRNHAPRDHMHGGNAAPGPGRGASDAGTLVDEHRDHAYTADKDALLKRLSRIEGQVRGIARMVDQEKYCIDILTQISAVNAALHKVSLGLVEDHIGHCVVGAARDAQESGDPQLVTDKVQEATAAIGRLLR
ncbi:metal-sensitive transcriptional regulator [Zafaria cholistanensis]|nr:metal-sensitive transcriptional regulator [Zafaria cholistanensis]